MKEKKQRNLKVIASYVSVGVTETSKRFNINHSSVYRIVNNQRYVPVPKEIKAIRQYLRTR